MKRNKASAEAGFTLLEIVAALAVAGLTLGILTTVFIQTGNTQERLKGSVTAGVLGASKLAELTRGVEPGTFGTFKAPYDRYHWRCETETGDDGVKDLIVEIEWSDKYGMRGKKKFHQYMLSE